MQPEHVTTSARITATGARAATDAAFTVAAELGVAVVVVVTDAAGDVVSVVRGDGAFKFSLEVARKKAWTAATAGARTAELAAGFVASPTLLHVLTPGVDELMPVGGGTPVLHDGMVVGAVGVSGATEEQDQQIADAAVAAVGG